MQEQALGCGLPSLPHHEAEQPDCPVPRPSGLSTATSHQTPPKRRWAEDTVVLCVGARAGRGVGGGWALRVGGKCGLVLQARWGRPWEPDAEPTGE